MLARLLPIILVLIGCGAGAAAGLYLRPAAKEDINAEDTAHSGDGTGAEKALSGAEAHDEGGTRQHEYVKLTNDFVVPVMKLGKVSSLIVMSLSMEVTPGLAERVYEMEPKLRDGFLQVLFDHANSGGFDGSFTDGANLVLLRQALNETARRLFGKDVTDVLILSIVRQEN